MRYLVSLYVWVVGGIYFVFLCLVTIILSFFLKIRTIDPFIKGSLKLLFNLIFVRVTVEGKDNVNPDLTYLFMANHSSLFDVPLLAAFIPTFVRGVEAQGHFKWPVYGWVLRRLGNIPINRSNIHSSIRSMHIVEKLLEKGTSVVILPEGHRSSDGKLQPFKKLPFHIAKQAGIPIIPIGLSGPFQLKNRGSWVVSPCPLTIRFGNSVPPEAIGHLSKDELQSLIRNRIASLIVPIQKDS